MQTGLEDSRVGLTTLSRLGSEPARWTQSDHQGSLNLTYSRPKRASGKSVLRSVSNVEGRMPTYEYRCRDCHHVFDRVEPLAQHGDRRPNCPKCKSKNVQQVLTPFFAKTSHKS